MIFNSWGRGAPIEGSETGNRLLPRYTVVAVPAGEAVVGAVPAGRGHGFQIAMTSKTHVHWIALKARTDSC